MTGPSQPPRSVSSLLTEVDHVLRQGLAAGATVHPTGFAALDATLTGGFRSGELVLVGGAAGNGKTTLGFQFARNAVAAGGTALVFSYEHEAHTLLERLISMEAMESLQSLEGAGAVDTFGISNAADVHSVRAAFEAGSQGAPLDALLAGLTGGREAHAALTGYGERLHLHESSGATTTLDEIARTVREVTVAAGAAPLVLVDYLQKIPVPGTTEDERTTAAVEGLKDLALEVGAPIVAISAADKDALASGHRMRTHDLRGTSSLAYEADVVLIVSDKVDVVSREHLVYDLGNIQRFRDWTVVTVEKNRHGRAHVELEFAKDFEHGRFHTRGNEVKERLIDERVFTT
ncbi:DnaB-like helicase C-terminal domain-containing protein [Intrasporangium calvum]|uniref:DnaB domain protein helicase domain protein n=1 Tax=Intrasporangium calvum (strain ATCC 23552 / DSM 43043 / JCM 3097 / NBRC 12989 / NCIMB 10167 / NRRL B-3866 / 7 KIP) TaxID=710696 RepID=E6SEA8_INTC7|nr:DnaB-like helicase C-terminal domain-containing protein [Intrasporangium calvum]ADU48756.1 DnaB domain protein helicase domain protein [Intrasporangium calvum DSM 43043]